MGPCGNNPGSQLILMLVASTGVARTFCGGDAGKPNGKVLMITLSLEKIGSVVEWCPASVSTRAIRN